MNIRAWWEDPDVHAVLADPTVRCAVKRYLEEAKTRDVVDAIKDLELAASVIGRAYDRVAMEWVASLDVGEGTP